MKFDPLAIPGAFEITLAPRQDHRGYFMRCFDRSLFEEHGLQTEWLQENQSMSVNAFTVRGLHFQAPPAAETKLVRCVQGELFDVMVDLRVGSPTYGRWHGSVLSQDNHKMLYIPKGCAHGFVTLRDNSIIAYKVDSMYTRQLEGALHYADPTIAIDWPIPRDKTLQISDKDREAKMLADFHPPFRFDEN